MERQRFLKQGGSSDREGMPKHTPVSRLRRGFARPLTRFTQRAPAAMTTMGRRPHAQASIERSTLLRCAERLPGGTTHGSIWLESTIPTSNATRLPGGGSFRGPRVLPK